MLEFFVGPPPPPMGKLVFDLDKGKLNLVCDSRHISFYKNLRRHSPLMQAQKTVFLNPFAEFSITLNIF